MRVRVTLSVRGEAIRGRGEGRGRGRARGRGKDGPSGLGLRGLTVSDAPSGILVLIEPCCTRPRRARSQKALTPSHSRATRPTMPRRCADACGVGLGVCGRRNRDVFRLGMSAEVRFRARRRVRARVSVRVRQRRRRRRRRSSSSSAPSVAGRGARCSARRPERRARAASRRWWLRLGLWVWGWG